MSSDQSPLLDTDPDAITRAFEADPFVVTDKEIDTLVIELRRRRNAFASKDATKQLNKKEKAPTPPPVGVVEQAKLNKPPNELTLDDLFGEES